MRTLAFIVGSVVITLAIMGMLGIGHFRFYYGPDDVRCVKEKP